MTKAIIFDKDGCLFQFEATWSSWATDFLESVSHADTMRAEKLGLAIGFDVHTGRFHADSPVIAGTPDDIVATLLPYLPGIGLEQLTQKVNEAATEVTLVEAVPLKPLLGDLRSCGYRLGLATNDAEAPARAHLQAVEVLEMFDHVYGSDSGVGAKPGPGQLLAFASAAGIAPGDTVMVGDSLHDMHAARAAGMVAVAVLTGPARAETLAPAADVVLPDIGHLPSWLAERAG